MPRFDVVLEVLLILVCLLAPIVAVVHWFALLPS